MENNIVIFTDKDIELAVNVSPEDDTVWLSLDQMADLFQKNKSTISRHVNNIFREGELTDASTVAFFATVQKEGTRQVERNIAYYNLDVIISVGYRVNSPRGIIFRRWATNVLRQYLKEGYAINEKRLAVLNRTVQIQSDIIAGVVGIDADDVLGLLFYRGGLLLLC